MNEQSHDTPIPEWAPDMGAERHARAPAASSPEHDPSAPPPLSQSREEWAVRAAHEAKRRAGDALTIAMEARDSAKRIETAVGRAPNPSLNDAGSGILGGLAKVHTDLAAIREGQARREETAAAIARSEEAARQRRATAWKIGVSIVSTAGALLGILQAFGWLHR
jgi:hypothetical protein